MPDTTDRIRGAFALHAPAKVNLYLEVLARRPDGYHAIESLMVAVSLFDTLEFMPSAALTLNCTQPDLTTGPDNLVFKAANVLRQRTGCRHGATIKLTKRIPMQAGLAGGSSDAATTLIGLNRLWNLRLSRKQLKLIAAEIGSDVAFFLDSPAAWCSGRGEIVEPVKLGRCLHLVLVCPQVGLSTADVYRHVNVPTQPQSGTAIQSAAQTGDIAVLGRALFNRLQEPAEKLCPLVKEIRDRLVAQAPFGCLMSGSGTTVFALCAGPRSAARLAQLIRQDIHPTPRVFVVRSCSRP